MQRLLFKGMPIQVRITNIYPESGLRTKKVFHSILNKSKFNPNSSVFLTVTYTLNAQLESRKKVRFTSQFTAALRLE